MPTNNAADSPAPVARDVIPMHAYTSGIKAGAATAAIAGAGVFAANRYWPAFRARMSVSGKTALVVSSFLGAFTIVSEKRILAGARNPDAYLAAMDGMQVDTKEKSSGLRWHEELANTVYDHPYRSLAGIGVPLVGAIFAYQASNHAIQRSQQIMHTRIYGQGAVVVLLLASMGFHDYMQKHGRFVAHAQKTEDVATKN
ncbi:hypothetical protein PINS_up014075 [Pythium insidiosum]|nr:hypothetical protein PINS_up014075 [Pythium insidiosum]